MPEMRSPLFVLGAGAGFFIAMYQWGHNISGDNTLAVPALHVLIVVHRIEQLRGLRFDSVLGLMGQLRHLRAQFQ
jgi:hypothetical protein